MLPATTDQYASFLRAAGHEVIATGTMRWYDANRLFYMASPPHRVFEPPAEELAALWRLRRCLGVRFAAPLEGPGKLSYQLSCRDPAYGLEKLSGNTRSKVRRGLKRCEVRPTELAVIREAGRKANEDTTARQGRDSAVSGDGWDRFFNAADGAAGFEGWGAWVEGELAAFLVTVTFDDAVEFMLARSCDDSLGAYPNNALIYTVTEEMLVRRGAPEVTFGLESLEPVTALDQFKFSMGYEAKPIRQRILFHPWAHAMWSVEPVRRLARHVVESRADQGVFWRKTAGILRFADESEFSRG